MPRPSLTHLRPLGAGAAVVAALALSGCNPGILSQSFVQNDEIGTAQVDQTLCAGLNPKGSPDGSPSCVTDYKAEFNATQFLLAYQVRDDVVAPVTIATTNDHVIPTSTQVTTEIARAAGRGTSGTTIPTESNQVVTYVQSPSYSSELQTLYPAPSGQHWAGYISNTLGPAIHGTPTGLRAPEQWDVSPQFTLQQPSDGPFTGPFTHATVVGYRFVDGPGSTTSTTGTAETDPVKCYSPQTPPPDTTGLSAAADSGDLAAVQRAAAKIAALGDPSAGNSYCDAGDDNDPSTAPGTRAPSSPDHSARPAGYTFANLSDATRDLWLGGSAGTLITQGTAGNVPFTAKFAGLGGPSFSMTATSDVPDAVIYPQSDVAPGADSTSSLPVRIFVPSATPAGRHTVTLTARGVNGQQRTATASFDVGVYVVAPSLNAPRVVIKHRFLVRLVRGGKERVRLSCPIDAKGCAGTVMFKSRFGNSNTVRYRLDAGTDATYTLMPSAKLLRYLHRHRRTALGSATVVVTGGGGQSSRVIHISPRP